MDRLDVRLSQLLKEHMDTGMPMHQILGVLGNMYGIFLLRTYPDAKGSRRELYNFAKGLSDYIDKHEAQGFWK
jgi:hypothetical protein